jgi:hypothetical protein
MIKRYYNGRPGDFPEKDFQSVIFCRDFLRIGLWILLDKDVLILPNQDIFVQKNPENWPLDSSGQRCLKSNRRFRPATAFLRGMCGVGSGREIIITSIKFKGAEK